MSERGDGYIKPHNTPDGELCKCLDQYLTEIYRTIRRCQQALRRTFLILHVLWNTMCNNAKGDRNQSNLVIVVVD